MSEPKILSIRQPWSWAILHAGKDVENRKWPTHVRGRFLIHAGKTVDTEGWEWMQSEGIQAPPLEQLPTGGVVGSAELIDCVDKMDSRWFFGPFGFVLQNPQPLPFAPLQGRLGFFRLPPNSLLKHSYR